MNSHNDTALTWVYHLLVLTAPASASHPPTVRQASLGLVICKNSVNRGLLGHGRKGLKMEDSRQEGMWSGSSQVSLGQSDVGFTPNSTYYLASCVTSSKYFIVSMP